MKQHLRTAALLVGLVVATSNSVSASIPLTEIALGGITPGATLEAMESIYGTPTSSKSAGAHFTKFYYGDSVIASVEMTQGRIRNLTVTKNNGFQTPAGIHVGMNLRQMKAAYGTPDSIYEQKAAPGVMPTTSYTYNGNTCPEEWSSNRMYLHRYQYQLWFVTDPGSDVIKEISVERLIK